MTDTSVGDWIEIAAPVLGEHLLFLVKESHQHRQRVAMRDEQLKIQTERVFESNHKLRTQSNEINVAHAHEDVAIKAAQAARETLAGERRQNNNQELLNDEDMAKALSDTRKAKQEIVVQKAVITKLTSDRVASTQARKLAEAQSKRLERVGIEYEDRLQEKEVKLAELTTTHQSLQEDMALTKAEVIAAQEVVAEAEREVRIAHDRVTTRIQPNTGQEEYPHLPDSAAVRSKLLAMENRIGRLQEENEVLRVRVNEDADLRTDMVESLTDSGAFISSESENVPRELLLRIQANILQAIDHDSSSRVQSPTPRTKKTIRQAVAGLNLFEQGAWAAGSPYASSRYQPDDRAVTSAPAAKHNEWTEVNRGSKGQGSSRGDAERGRRQEADVSPCYGSGITLQNFRLPEGSGQSMSVQPGTSVRDSQPDQPTTPGRRPVAEDVVVSAYSPRQPEMPSLLSVPSVSPTVGAAREQEIPDPRSANVGVHARDARASSSTPSVPRAQQDFFQPGRTGQAVLQSQLSPPTMAYDASMPAVFNREKLAAGLANAADVQAKVVARPSIPAQEPPKFRDVSYSIRNAVRSLQVAGHGDKNFWSCRGAFNRVSTQWKVTEDQRKLCMPYCFTEDASRIFEVIANDYPSATSEVWWDKMQQKVSNEAQAQSSRQEFMNLRKLPQETMRAYADRGWRLASCLPEQPTEIQVKPQIIMGLPPKLKTAALLAQSLPFDNMVSTIEQIIANEQAQPQPRIPRNRESLQIVDEQAAEELAIFHEKQRQTYDDKEHKVWTKQGVGTLESPMGPRDDVLPFGFSAAKPCFRCKFIGHLASYRGIVCERSSQQEGVTTPPNRRQQPKNSRPKNV